MSTWFIVLGQVGQITAMVYLARVLARRIVDTENALESTSQRLNRHSDDLRILMAKRNG